MKVDPLSIKTDQRKRDNRRDAWDRDYMGAHYVVKTASSTAQVSAATPVLVFAFFFVCLLILIHSGD